MRTVPVTMQIDMASRPYLSRTKVRINSTQIVIGIDAIASEMLDSPDLDVIYNPLPNYYHFEWTMKALKAGKHVLLEKPSAENAEEIRQMIEFAKQKNLVLLEAFHYR
jgi:predicted dehydrogenase